MFVNAFSDGGDEAIVVNQGGVRGSIVITLHNPAQFRINLCLIRRCVCSGGALLKVIEHIQIQFQGTTDWKSVVYPKYELALLIAPHHIIASSERAWKRNYCRTIIAADRFRRLAIWHSFQIALEVVATSGGCFAP